MKLASGIRRCASATALTAVFVCSLLTIAAAPSWAEDESLSVKPNHGQATASFKATYEVRPAPDNCEQSVVGFYWDGAKVANVSMTLVDSGLYSEPGRKLYYCRASAEITPPESKRQVGTHEVGGARGYPGGSSAVAPVTYTIDPSPAAAPPPSEGPPGQSAPTTGSTPRSSQPAAPKQGKTTTSSAPSEAIPAPITEAVTGLSPSPTPSQQSVAARVSPKSQLSGTFWIWLIGGVALLIAIAVGLIVRRRSRLSKGSG